MSCHVMSCHVMSCHVMSCHVMSCHVMSCHVMSYHIISCHSVSCCIIYIYHIISCHSMSQHVMLYHIWYHIISIIACHIISCHIISCHSMSLTYHIISYHIISYHSILSWCIMSWCCANMIYEYIVLYVIPGCIYFIYICIVLASISSMSNVKQLVDRRHWPAPITSRVWDKVHKAYPDLMSNLMLMHSSICVCVCANLTTCRNRQILYSRIRLLACSTCCVTVCIGTPQRWTKCIPGKVPWKWKL